VWALSQIVLAWVDDAYKNGLEDGMSQLCYEELTGLARTHILEYLMISNVDLFVECIIVPLLLQEPNPLTGHAVPSFILETLTEHLFSGGRSKEDDFGDEKEKEGQTNFRKYAQDHICIGIAQTTKKSARTALAMLASFQENIACTNSLLDERPSNLYRLLTCSETQKFDEKDLLRGELAKMLNDCAQRLEVPITYNEAAESSLITITTTQHTLMHLVWDLGSNKRDARFESARFWSHSQGAKVDHEQLQQGFEGLRVEHTSRLFPLHHGQRATKRLGKKDAKLPRAVCASIAKRYPTASANRLDQVLAQDHDHDGHGAKQFELARSTCRGGAHSRAL